MKKLSQRKIRCAQSLALFGCVVMLAGGLFKSPACCGAGIAMLLAGVVLCFSAFRCPHCGAPFRGALWSGPDAGFCRNCGQKIEFDR